VAFLKGSSGAWTVDPAGPQPPADLELDPEAAGRLVSSLASLRAASLAEGVTAAAAGLDAPEVTVTVDLSGGSSATLALGNTFTGSDKGTLVYARGNADDLVYALAEAHLERFTRGWEAFKLVPPPPGGNPFANLDPETLKNLPPEVRESLLKQMQEQAEKERILDQIRRQQAR
jgi:hypothetical protein